MSHLRTSGTEEDLRTFTTARDNVLVAEQPASLENLSSTPDNFHAVLDQPSGSVTFIAAAGPFRSYERTVSWERADGSILIDQTVRFRLAIPYWAWLFHLPAARSLRDGLEPSVRPWWSTPDRLSPDQARIVAAATLLNVVGGMLYSLLTQVLTFISADLGNGSSGEQTTVLAIVRAGVVITVVVAILADRIGRRRTALYAFYGSAVITIVTAFLPSLPMVTVAQFVSRNLAIAALLAADTIATEEMPAGSRAMVAGLGTLAYGLGAGIVVMTIPLTDIGPWGWRLTFLVAGCSLPLIIHSRRYLPESRRFRMLDLGRGEPTELSQDGAAAAPTSQPTTGTSTRHRYLRRFLLIGAMFVLFNIYLAPSSQLQNDYLRTEAGFSGTVMALFVLMTSTPGGIGVIIGGRVADLYGRRWAIVPGLTAMAVFYTLFFSSTGTLMWVSSVLASIIGGMAAPALAVITAELFPTVRRATVRGVVTALAVVGSISGLLIGGALIERIGYAHAFLVLAAAPLLAATLAFLLPQTHRRELEVTSS